MTISAPVIGCCVVEDPDNQIANRIYTKNEINLMKQNEMKNSSREKVESAEPTKRTFVLVWKNIIGFFILHLMAAYGAYLSITSVKFATLPWSVFVTALCQIGVTVGAHRLYTHRSFEAIAPLRLFLLMCHTMAGQNCMYIWVRDHRQHHKYSDTDADPHNAKNGFFFSHIGWLMCRKHPEVIAKGKGIDMADLQADPHVMFQAKYYKPLYTLFAILIPVFVPYLMWNEDLFTSFFVAYMFRYMFVVNVTWLVNSAAHLYGTRPYDKNLQPVEQPIVSFLTMGEGWHNFHHAVPWDYRAAEYGMHFNHNAFMIEQFERLGWASNLRSVSKEALRRRVERVGDGSHHLWGFGDKDADQKAYGVMTSTNAMEQKYIDMLYVKKSKSKNAMDNKNRKMSTRSG